MTPSLTPKLLFSLLAAAAASGCSEGSSLSTSSIFGAASTTPVVATAPVVTPSSRALQVGGTAARAKKCGYNFDLDKLRGNYLAYEASQAPGADQSTTVATYDTAYNGVTKAAASQSGYCSATKTQEIKSALNRHLAGDYTPDPPKPKEAEEGLFSSWGGDSGSSSSYQSPTLPTDNSRD